jgi:hypothetical protein
MKEQFEERMTKKIREVLEKYEPAYSPQAWEKLRDQMPVPLFWLKRLLLKYKLLVSDIAIVGVLVMVYNFSNIQPADNNSAIDPMSSENANYFVPEEQKEINYPENRVVSISGTSDIIINKEERNISYNFIPVNVAGINSATYEDYIQTGTTNAEIPASIERDPFNPVSLKGIGFGRQSGIAQLVPIKSQAEEIPGNKSHASGKARNFDFQWPEFNSLFKKEDGYDKFTGPNKLALFYSPEMLHSNSSGNLGIAQGIGLSFEGAVRSSVSVSAGLSYQAIAFGKTTITQNAAESPMDTTIESGNYKYLEIPLSFNFKFLEGARSQVWFGTGLSSMIFLKQDYTTVTIVDGVKDEASSSAKGWGNVIPLASFNIGLLYRYHISNRFSLHSSLQYKIHLMPLGYNSMKLDRLNFQVGIIYRFRRED